MHAKNHAYWHAQNEDIECDLTCSTGHPEQVIIEAVTRVGEAVDPAPFQWDAVRESSNCAADPPTDDKRGCKVELISKSIRNVKDPIVHEQNANFCGTGNAEVQDGGCEGEFQVHHIVVCVDVRSVRVFGNPEAIGVDAVC